MLKRIFCLFFASVLTLGLPGSLDARSSEGYKPPCDTSITSICTIEIWLAHKQKKKDKQNMPFHSIYFEYKSGHIIVQGGYNSPYI